MTRAALTSAFGVAMLLAACGGATGGHSTPSSTAGINDPLLHSDYCDGLSALQPILVGLQNSTITNSEAVTKLDSVQSKFTKAVSDAQALSSGDSQFMSEMQDLATATGHLKVTLDSGADTSAAVSELNAAVQAAPSC